MDRFIALVRAIVLCISGTLVLSVLAEAKELTVPVCYGFSCKTKNVITVTPSDWRSVVGWFDTRAKTPEDERQQIRQAIGWMEVIVGRYTPTHQDKGLNLEKRPTKMSGQMDCIDESINTTTYLTLFEQQGHLRWHRVVDRAYRGALFDAHWAAQIEQINSGTSYVVDSWFQDNGMLPYVKESLSWGDLGWWSLRLPRDN